MTDEQFRAWSKGARGVLFRVEYVDICDGDVQAGLLLSQIIYWCMPSKKTGKPKVSVFREGRYWVAKKKAVWERETRLKRDAFDNAADLLKSLGIIERTTYHFRDRPALHVSLNYEAFLFHLECALNAEILGDSKPISD